MRISDEIAAYILHIMDEAEDGIVQLRRNELAETLGCVPSQINYVLTSRFSPEQGYVVESRRGGGGYVRIHRVKYNAAMTPLMHVVNAIGDTVSLGACNAILESLVHRGHLNRSVARVCAAAVSDQALREVVPDQRDRLRAALLKQMLTVHNM